MSLASGWSQKNFILRKRWPWHVLFWIGYILFRFWLYYITVKYYPRIYLGYMLFSEILFVGATYFTTWLYSRLFEAKKYLVYFLTGAFAWAFYLCGRIAFQVWYLKTEPSFKINNLGEVFISNITYILVCFLFITACKYFKDGYIRQQLDAQRKQEQLTAEVNNLKSQIAPHFLFNTLNNLYGLAVEKSDKLPDLMLRLSDLLRHSLYETQKPFVSINEEMNVLKGYIKLETVRLEDDLKLEFDNTVPEDAGHQIAPLLLIVFVENAFKHAKFVQSAPVAIYIKTMLTDDWFIMTVKNNYNTEKENSPHGIGLANVKRRLDVLYPSPKHQLTISRDDTFYTVHLRLQLEKTM